MIFCFQAAKDAGKAAFFRGECTALRILKYSFLWEGQGRYVVDVPCARSFTTAKTYVMLEFFHLKKIAARTLFQRGRPF